MVGSLLLLVAVVLFAVCGFLAILPWLRKIEEQTRPFQSDEFRFYKERYDALPEHVKTSSQILGRSTMGCEGTHSVFPQCNFTCKPCYHSRDANDVRVDGDHTVTEVEQQMSFLLRKRGSGVHCQLIGGEVSLLQPEDHAKALDVMLGNGRIPMSFTNGDFDYDYLRRLATTANGSARFRKLSFAAHFDRFMYGRRGIRRPKSESDLHEYRARFCSMFHRLKGEGLVQSFFLAHNMTITPGNVDEIPDVIKMCHSQGWSLMSFQPAAFVGDDARWNQHYRAIDPDEVWKKIEEGVGRSLPYKVLQMGDERCNRSVWGFWVGQEYFPFLEDNAEDHFFRDMYLKTIGPIQFSNPSVPWHVPLIRSLRIILQSPFLHSVVLFQFLWKLLVQRIGLLKLTRGPIRHMTFVMHNFMDADVVKRAHLLNQQGTLSSEGNVREAQERLKACSYTFGHPKTGELIPACVQHSILDPDINKNLKELLPRCGASKDLEW